MSSSSKKIIIRGVTQDGRRFRPSDWAQRLSTAVGSIGPGRRVMFHPKVTMALIEGISCVVVDATLEGEEPQLYDFLIKFGEHNNLQIDRVER